MLLSDSSVVVLFSRQCAVGSCRMDAQVLCEPTQHEAGHDHRKPPETGARNVTYLMHGCSRLESTSINMRGVLLSDNLIMIDVIRHYIYIYI